MRDKAFAQDERNELADLNTTIAALDYDAEAHQQVRQQVASLRRFDAAHHALSEAQANLPGISESLQTGRQILTERQADIDAAAERMNTLKQDIESLPLLTAELEEAMRSSEQLESELRQAGIDRGVLENNISRCEEMETQIHALEQKHRGLARDKGIYDELTLAFGKNGIQALVIESAIPQLQDDANEILGRITENRMHLKLELDESTSEQLEIRIADELGTRDYLTFSGGEAFRINFSLRIALSRLLARRSGAAAARAIHRRGIRLAGQEWAGTPDRSHPVNSGRIREDYRHNAHRTYERSLPSPNRGQQGRQRFDLQHRVTLPESIGSNTPKRA